ncbi:MAG: hypothetical protein ABEK36_06365, partial [Candidatus Aenigmatarchaeota archaeon]
QFDTDHIQGDSPPSVFIGRYDYPNVNVGPLVPPERGDTSLYSTPENWFGKKNINDIISMRGSLVRGKKRLGASVEITDSLSKEIEETRYLVLSKKPAESEVTFKKKLNETIRIDGESQPYGPSAQMTSFNRGTMTSSRQLEKVFYDEDLKAKNAVVKLHKKGINVSKIQDIFMVGGTGLKNNRKFVPTRWSITAVDDILGKDLRREVKTYPRINSYHIYQANYLDNRWIIIFTPESWRYESIEAFYPETTWNPSSDSIAIFGDSEEYDGKKEYASIGGCYYAARLAVLEKLQKNRRQAGVLILREVHPGYILPVGVWNVRESVRNAMKNRPRKINTKKEVMNFIDKKMDIPLDQWISVSRLLKTRRTQKSLKDFSKND